MICNYSKLKEQDLDKLKSLESGLHHTLLAFSCQDGVVVVTFLMTFTEQGVVMISGRCQIHTIHISVKSVDLLLS